MEYEVSVNIQHVVYVESEIEGQFENVNSQFF